MMRSLFKSEHYKQFSIDPVTTIITEVRYIGSPNFDLRPVEDDISLLVLHGISLPPGEFTAKSPEYIIDLFTNQLDHKLHPYFNQIVKLQVAPHCLITRSGELIQFVPFKYRAWHAGESSFNGRANCNDFSIGIELEGTDYMPYTSHQYLVLIPLIQAIKRSYPQINSNQIVGHSHIAPQRKNDPGKFFDWTKINLT